MVGVSKPSVPKLWDMDLLHFLPTLTLLKKKNAPIMGIRWTRVKSMGSPCKHTASKLCEHLALPTDIGTFFFYL